MPIHLLPPEIASQIAAGEVIERPASVVKELVENALDAQARAISIQVAGAGQRLMEISDDGVGIEPDELELAVARHATSKLNSADDLFRITSLGFRGEALASIASVSRLTITSRPAHQAVGRRIRVEGGRTISSEPVGAPAGTTVRVEDLFYNVPARLKFLKQESTERRQIDSLVTQYALAYPEVRFMLKQDDRVSLQTSGNGSRREVLAVLHGAEVARILLEVIFQEDDLQITGFISPTTLTRSNRREVAFFVNGRPVHDNALVTAVLQAYHTLLMVGRFPMGYLFLKMPPEMVDVNVHPAKAEVRFRDSNRVFSAVQRAVRRALLAHTPVPEVGAPALSWSGNVETARQPRQPGLAWEMAATSEQAGSGQPETPELIEKPSTAALPSPFSKPILRLIGQIAAAYLVAEGPDGLYLIDQHAAHERVLYEKLMSQWQGRAPGAALPAQALLQPVTVEVSPAAASLLSSRLPFLESLGFQVELFGPRVFLIRTMPQLLATMEPAAALKALVEDFEEDETPLQGETERRLVARICKRAAVKAGQVLSPSEQQALISDLESCESPRTCPHGRPTMIHLSVDLLEKQFGRRGAR